MPPKGGWLPPGPGRNVTAEDFLAGKFDQTPEEYEAEIEKETGGKKPPTWQKMFGRKSAALKRKGK